MNRGTGLNHRKNDEMHSLIVFVTDLFFFFSIVERLFVVVADRWLCVLYGGGVQLNWISFEITDFILDAVNQILWTNLRTHIKNDAVALIVSLTRSVFSLSHKWMPKTCDTNWVENLT